MHVAEALVYLIVTALAVAIAVTASRGAARAARACVVAAVLAAPVLIISDLWIPLGFPDHTGTTVFVLLSFLLVDLDDPLRGGSGGSSPPELAELARRFTAPLVCLILVAGQISDVTVRYVAVPAIAGVCGYRVLAARALFSRWREPADRTGDAANLVAAAISVPLSLAATRPPQTPPVASLTAWLETHGLRYGLAGYWDGSAVTLQSAGRVQVRTVEVNGGKITPFPWETNTAWFDPAQHYANFVIFGVVDHDLPPAAERYFGKPAAAHRVGGFEVLVYDKNVLRVVRPPVLPPTS